MSPAMSTAWNGRVDDIGDGSTNVASDVDDMERERGQHRLELQHVASDVVDMGGAMSPCR